MMVFDRLINSVREAARNEDLLTTFGKLSTDNDRIEFIESLDCVRDIVIKDSFREKSEAKAHERLQQCDQNSSQAVIGYTRAVKFAPPGSTELAKCFLARAHALYKIGNYLEAAEDARRSLKGELTVLESIKATQIEARCQQNLGLQPQAEATLQRALQLLRSSSLQNETKASLAKELVQDIKNNKQHSVKETKKEVSTELPHLDYGQNTRMPAASAALELHWSKEKGRHLVANRDIRIGSVLIAEHPYAWSLSTEALDEHCLHCCRLTNASLPCLQCSTVCYCSEQCRDDAWKQYHKFECRVFDHLTLPQELSKMALLSYRTVVIARCGWTENQRDVDDYGNLAKLADKCQSFEGTSNQKNTDFLSNAYSSVYGQLTHSKCRNSPDLFKRAATAVFLAKGLCYVCDYQIETLTFATAVLHHLQSCSSNAYQISKHLITDNNARKAVEVEIGGSVYPTISLTNHSCYPNVVRHTYGNICVLRSIASIRVGEEILDNYGPHFLLASKQERQDQLKSQYFFECNCQPCKSNWPTVTDLRMSVTHFKCIHCCYDLGRDLQKIKNCSHCKRKLDYKKIAKKFQQLNNNVDAVLDKLADGQIQQCLKSSLENASMLEAIVVQPCMELIRWQQIIRQCWGLLSNVAHAVS